MSDDMKETIFEHWLFKFVKENPFKTMAGIATLLGIMVTTVWAADERFNQMPQIGEIHRQMIYDKEQRLEDSIFILQMKAADGTASNIDKAMLERYKTRLNTLKRK